MCCVSWLTPGVSITENNLGPWWNSKIDKNDSDELCVHFKIIFFFIFKFTYIQDYTDLMEQQLVVRIFFFALVKFLLMPTMAGPSFGQCLPKKVCVLAVSKTDSQKSFMYIESTKNRCGWLLQVTLGAVDARRFFLANLLDDDVSVDSEGWHSPLFQGKEKSLE